MNYSPFRHLGSVIWKRRPLQLTFFLTQRCNAKCAFCFYRANGREQTPRREELSLEEIRKISASMGPLLWLAFSGGEIFLREDIVEITRIFYQQNKPSIILLPTNGQLPGVIRDRTEEILRSCKKSTVVIKLSLDGPEEIHDRMRGIQGAFKTAMETYKLLGDLLAEYENFELGMNTVFCATNQDRMEEIVDYVQGLDNIMTHTVSLIRGDIPDSKLKEIEPERYGDTSQMLEQNVKKKLAGRYRFYGSRVKTAQDILQRRLIYKTLVQQRRLTPCFAGQLTLVITERGDVYPCESFVGKMGNLRESDYDIHQILRSDEGQKVLQEIGRKQCHCTHECYFMMNILFNPMQYPALLKEYIHV